MNEGFRAGDFLLFQLESGYAMLRVLSVGGSADDRVWHVAAYQDLFMDIESADAAASTPERLAIAIDHIALTNRAFESTQVSKLRHLPLTSDELGSFEAWKKDPNREVSDRSIRLTLGLR